MASSYEEEEYLSFLFIHIRKITLVSGGYVLYDIIRRTVLIDGHLKTKYAKYQSHLASGFGAEDFLSFQFSI